jgi:purine nucleosidase
MPEKIVLDIDGAGDDILAVLFAAGHPGIDLLGVTACHGAAGAVEQVTRVALNALSTAGREDIPVARGAWRPIRGNSKEDTEAPVHFEKRLQALLGERLKGFNPPAPEPTRGPVAQHAVDFIIAQVRAHPGEVSVVATGPQTNVALALRMAPDIAGMVKRFVVLGGCFTTPGNITPVSEYNIWADPEAARVVLRSGAPVILVPLDVCEDNRVAPSMLTRDDLEDLAHLAPEGRAVTWVRETFPVYVDIWRNFFELVGFPLDDAIAVATVVSPELFDLAPPCFVDVALSERQVRGQTIAHRGVQILSFEGPRTTRVARDIEGRAFMAAFKSALVALG